MDKQFMKLAFDVAKNSKAKRLQVGAVIVDSANKIISTGCNNMPKVGFSDCCEYYDTYRRELITRPELIHAEENAIGYATKRGYMCKDAIIYITDSPCLQCAKLIYLSGITKVVYCRPYRLNDGIDFLKNVGINVEQLNFDYNG